MLLKTFVRTLALSCGVLATTGCQYSPEMTQRALAYNEAVATSTNQQILLNIIRASERKPRYFTRFGANSAQTSISGSLATTFPVFEFNGGSSTGSIIPSPSASTGNSVTLDNLDDKKCQVGAMQPVSLSTIDQFWKQGI
jgi:hypothetical protein